MAAPNKLKVSFPGHTISAFYLGEQKNTGKTGIVCRNCAPARTKMFFLADVVFPSETGDKHYTCYECLSCRRQWCVSSDPIVPVEVGE